MIGKIASCIKATVRCSNVIFAWSIIYFASNFATAALIVIPAPPSVQPGAIQSQTDAVLFLESVSTLASPLAVDIAAPGLYTNTAPNAPGVIPASTQVASYMIHHESIANAFSSVLVSYTFPQPILGVITTDALLDASDIALGNPGTSYPAGLANRGLELPFTITPDAVFWSGNQVFFQVESNTAAVLDQLRVLTAVPEPSTILLFAAMAICVSATGRRRQVLDSLQFASDG
jgi:hypothetical protein